MVPKNEGAAPPAATCTLSPLATGFPPERRVAAEKVPKGQGIPNLPARRVAPLGLPLEADFLSRQELHGSDHRGPDAPEPPRGRPDRAPQRHSRECSSSRAALAARSRPVGSKLLHLSLGAGRSPAPRSPPPSAPGCAGGSGSGGPAPSPLGPLMPKSHDMASEHRAPQAQGSEAE